MHLLPLILAAVFYSLGVAASEFPVSLHVSVEGDDDLALLTSYFNRELRDLKDVKTEEMIGRFNLFVVAIRAKPGNGIAVSCVVMRLENHSIKIPNDLPIDQLRARGRYVTNLYV